MQNTVEEMVHPGESADRSSCRRPAWSVQNRGFTMDSGWIPAFAGMTGKFFAVVSACIVASAGIVASVGI